MWSVIRPDPANNHAWVSQFHHRLNNHDRVSGGVNNPELFLGSLLMTGTGSGVTIRIIPNVPERPHHEANEGLQFSSSPPSNPRGCPRSLRWNLLLTRPLSVDSLHNLRLANSYSFIPYLNRKFAITLAITLGKTTVAACLHMVCTYSHNRTVAITISSILSCAFHDCHCRR
jgi:hypothetical protein